MTDLESCKTELSYWRCSEQHGLLLGRLRRSRCRPPTNTLIARRQLFQDQIAEAGLVLCAGSTFVIAHSRPSRNCRHSLIHRAAHQCAIARRGHVLSRRNSEESEPCFPGHMFPFKRTLEVLSNPYRTLAQVRLELGFRITDQPASGSILLHQAL